MIYIDTRDQLSLKHGVMEFLNVTEEELELVFETIDSVDEDPYDWVKKYLEDYGIDSPLEYIQMFHLTTSAFVEDAVTLMTCGELIFWMAESSGAVSKEKLNELCDQILAGDVKDRRHWNRVIQSVCYDSIVETVTKAVA